MLSFDITDRSIKIIKGNPSGGKIRVQGSYILDVPEGMILNGRVEDLQGLSRLIADTLKQNDLLDKEAIVSFSSNSIIFKELIVPKAKGDALLSIVQNEMQSTMGLDGNYSISYTVVGDAGESNPNSIRVLATACPFDVVDSYRKLFSRTPCSLKAVNISCNCITRVVLLDKKAEEKMPMLVCQVDENFLSLNLYENGQLSFARFVTISPDDYDAEDYIVEALKDNIFRMNQFNRVRGGSGIETVVFYGNVYDFIKLTDALDSLDVKTSILNVPSQITGFENFEFTVFANAIGAMFKRKETERINLLEIDAKTGRSGSGLNGFLITLIATAAVCIGAVFGVRMYVVSQENKLRDEAADYEARSAALRTTISYNDKLTGVLNNISTYQTGATDAKTIFDTYPVINKEVIDTIENCARGLSDIVNLTYASGEIGLEIETTNQDNPRQVAQRLDETGYFADVIYNGYEGSDEVSYSITIYMKAREVE